MQDGRLLAELRRQYAEQLDDYLAWAADRGYPEADARLNYRRAFIGWYEARGRPDHPYTGGVFDYVTTLAARYFGEPGEDAAGDFPLGDGPLDYLPATVTLDAPGRAMLARLKADPDCLNLLLLTDYHRMEPAAVARALDLEDEYDELPERIEACRYALEAESPGGSLLYTPVITVAGRQDLMETLGRTDAPNPAPRASPAPAPIGARPPAAKTDVPLSPRRRWRIGAPSPGMLLAGLLTGVLLYLVYDTFGSGADPRGRYTDFFTPYPNVFATTPPATAEERDLNRILYYYDRGDYRAAYDELLPAADAYPGAPLYLGVSALALDDPARAQEWLARVGERGPYAAPAEWYRALALLAGGEGARAEGLLRGIAGAPDHPYRERAQALLDAL